MPIKIRELIVQNILIPFALLAIGLSLRLSLIGKGFYHPDNLFLAIQAEKILATHQMHYLHLVGYPLTALLGALFLKIGQLLGITDPAFSINSMSVVFNSLTIVVFYFLIKKIFDPLTALLSAAIILVHPVSLATSVFGNSHAPSLFFFFTGLYLLHLSRFYGKTVRANIYLWFSAVCAGCMIAARPQNIILLIPFSYIFWIRIHPESVISPVLSKIKKFFTFLAITTVTVLLLFGPLLLSQPGLTAHHQSFESLLRQVLPNMDTLPLWLTLRHILLTFTPLGTIFIVLGLATVLHKSLRLFAFILCLALPLWLFYGCFLTYVPRYTQGTVIALTIPIGYFLARQMEKSRQRQVGGAVFYCLLLFLLFARISHTLLFRHQNDVMKDFGLWVKEQTRPESIIICQDMSAIIRHFSGRETRNPPVIKFAHRTYGSEDAKRIEAELATLRAILIKGIPLYVTRSALMAYDPKQHFFKALQREYHVELIGEAIMEDWHPGVLDLYFYREGLYEIFLR